MYTDVFWSTGKVLSIDKANKSKRLTKFNLVYEEEPDIVWSFPLLLDFEKGDVIIVN